ncbi:DUF2771 domain-containing protein [Corynebacterium felinum]|uniref:DUF2771 domain-containing protein n=1 Tax=Corynebacterium felinum TaxID=131318 RepID=A0ABU2B8R7_9CORY|nr:MULTISPECIES: DUF2771 domain-containing protein [Corynebacterium]MDF5820288.1 DUF2771 domain-containing protein [Corynebacterium felinum]MDO4761999.1 DUF2771 domain-containing protein [Corynebacterium sp.]MDR7355006.1 hypothetical protein [Corynebacterium felinum]WJY94360.1 hypothetical protein CFELI_03630 [Corynebacterium felinum]
MKAKTRKTIIQISGLVAAVAVVVVASVLFQNWWNNRPGPEPRDVAIQATIQDDTTDVFPFSICEPGVECEEAAPTILKLGADETMKLVLPKHVYDHDWSLLKIYDDPAANDEHYFGAYEQQTVDIKGSAEPVEKNSTTRPQLVVVEVKAVMIGHDANGVETPYTTTWSIGFDSPATNP